MNSWRFIGSLFLFLLVAGFLLYGLGRHIAHSDIVQQTVSANSSASNLSAQPLIGQSAQLAAINQPDTLVISGGVLVSDTIAEQLIQQEKKLTATTADSLNIKPLTVEERAELSAEELEQYERLSKVLSEVRALTNDLGKERVELEVRLRSLEAQNAALSVELDDVRELAQ